MPGRNFFCAMLLLLFAGAAFSAEAKEAPGANERIAYRPAVDTMSLLMADQGATFAIAETPAQPMLKLPELRNFDMRDADLIRVVQPMPRMNLSAFESMNVSAFADRPAEGGRPAKPLTFTYAADLKPHADWGQRIYVTPVTAHDGGGWAVAEAMNGVFRRRPPRVMDAMVTLHLDGRPESAPFSIDGGAVAAIWQAIPKN
jgi:hypothetical protein